MKSYIVKPSLNQVVSQHQRASITTFSFQDRGKLDSSYFVKISGDENAAADIENENLQASFSPCTGLLQHIYRKSDSSVFHTEIKLMTYGTGSWSNPYQDKSGAYVFLPDGAAQELDLFHPEMLLVKGPLMSTVHTRFFGIQHSVYLYNISGPLGAALHIKNLVNIGSDRWNNKELIMRLETDIFNTNGNICTDFNGFQLHRRKTRHKMTTQGNFYPLTTMAFLESDHGTRLTLLTSEAHGVASLTPGWIEVVLDRRLMQDDWRGLNQGVKDNILTPSHFMVLVEKLTASSVGEESAAGPACFPSILSHVLSENLNNPLVSAVSPSSELGSAVLPMNKALTKQLACSMVLVNLRSIKPENESSITALLLVHHVGIDCSYQDIYMKCHGQDTLDFQIFQHLSSVTEMSLSGVTATRRVNSMQVKITPMEIRTYKLSFR